MSEGTPRIRVNKVEYAAIMKSREEGGKLDALLAGTGTSNMEDRQHGKDFSQRTISCVSEIHTVEQLIAHAQVDMAIWRVKEFTAKKWEMGYKDGDAVAQVKGLFAVSAKFERIAPKQTTDTLESLHARLLKHVPVKYSKKMRHVICGDPHLAVFALYDAHFGKLAWAKEGYDDYDLKIAEEMFANACDDLMRYISHLNITRVMFPIGNDFLHVDNSRLTTEQGTDMGAATEGRYARIVETGFLALVKAIDKMRTVAAVDCVFVKGNHDPTSTYHLMRELRAHYRNVENVNIDVGPRDRKYYHWDEVLIGLTHGNKEPISRLMNLMPMEEPDKWAQSKYREWHIGHVHKRAQLVTKGVETYEGLTVRTMPSLSATDAWHYGKGYKGTRAADVYLYSTDGYRGHFAADARLEETEE